MIANITQPNLTNCPTIRTKVTYFWGNNKKLVMLWSNVFDSFGLSLNDSLLIITHPAQFLNILWDWKGIIINKTIGRSKMDCFGTSPILDWRTRCRTKSTTWTKGPPPRCRRRWRRRQRPSSSSSSWQTAAGKRDWFNSIMCCFRTETTTSTTTTSTTTTTFLEIRWFSLSWNPLPVNYCRSTANDGANYGSLGTN